MIAGMSREHRILGGMSGQPAVPRPKLVHNRMPHSGFTAMTTDLWRSAVPMSIFLDRSLYEQRRGVSWRHECQMAVLHIDTPALSKPVSPYFPVLRAEENQPYLTGPVRILRKILTTWRLDGQDRFATALLGFDEADSALALNILDGRKELKGRDVKDRIVCLYEIRKTLHSLLRDEKVENEWLRESHPGLDGNRPMTLMLEGSMENLLLVRDYVETVAGL